MSVIPFVILLVAIGGGPAFASEDDQPSVESEKCKVTKLQEIDGWGIFCNITVPGDLTIYVVYDAFAVKCKETNNSNSLRTYFPDVQLHSMASLYQMSIVGCTDLSYAEVIAKITNGNKTENGLRNSITVFGREVKLTDQQMKNMQIIKILYLMDINVQSITSEDFSPLPQLYGLRIADCCIRFESTAFNGLHILQDLELKGSKFILPGKIFNGLRNLSKFRYRYHSISLMPDNLFKNNILLFNISINYNNQLKSLPENLFSNLSILHFLYLNDNALENLPPYLFSNCASLAEINLSRNQLKSIPEYIFTDVAALVRLYLNDNLITDLPRNMFKNQRELQWLDLANNRLHNIEPVVEMLFSYNKLWLLRLDGNGMNISIELLKAFQENERLYTISIARNRLDCDCDRAKIISTIMSSGKEISIADITCNDGKSFSDESLDWYCDYSTLNIIITVIVITPIVLLTTAIALYYKYETHLKVFLYSRGCCLRWITEEELDRDKKYDVFISFSHKDEAFVMNELVNRIEGPPYHFKACVHYRDWFAGEVISKQICDSIQNSRRTIIVLSPDFLNSKWSKFEFRIAHYNTLKERRTRLIALIYKDIGDLEEIDGELNAYLQTDTYVKWGDPWFWDKLNYALPHASNNNASEDIEMQQV